ncbi:MAG TPA: hypothetical protein VGF06_08385 [Terriglobales bacterium]
MAYRWEMDLSPGKVTVPATLRAGWITMDSSVMRITIAEDENKEESRRENAIRYQ